MRPRLVSLALGVWLVVAPDVLQYGDPARMHDRIVGPLVAAVAMVAMSEVMRALRWLNVAAGAWLIVAPFVLGFDTPAMVSSIAAGSLLVACGRLRGRTTQRYAGGWSALLRPPASSTES